MKECNLDQKWSFLPQELWEKIYKSLLIADRIRSSLVCKSWLSAAVATPHPPPEPWLIFLDNNDGHQAPENNPKFSFQKKKNNPKFLSLSEKKFYNFNKVTPHQDCKILGASNGWVLFERIGRKKKIFLVNPILNEEISFPSLDYDKIGDLVKVLVVSSSLTKRRDSDKPVGIIILGNIKTTYTTKVACITCEDRTWRYHYIGTLVIDIVIYDRKLYSLVYYLTPWVTTFSLDEHLKPHRLNSYRIDVEGVDFNHRGYSHNDREAYFVECGGNLLVLQRFLLQPRYGFEVFRLTIDDPKSWRGRGVKLLDLGDQALFLGKDGCIVLPAEKCEQPFQEGVFKKNHVYFGVQSEYGVYSLEFGNLKPISDLASRCLRESTWFVPTCQQLRMYDFFPQAKGWGGCTIL